MKAVTRHWYRIALHAASGETRLVAASGEHLGQAVAEAERAGRGAWAAAVEPATGSEIPLGESVGKGQIVELGALAQPVAGFRWPTGIVPTLAGAAALAGACRGWIERAPRVTGPTAGDASSRAPAHLYVIEAQTEADRLVDLFLGLIERLPAADNLEVRVLDHFEDAGATDVWLTSRVDARRILRFLDDHDEELVGNGHLELSVYVRRHKATLRLTEHKTVVWLAEQRALADDVKRWLGELAVPRVDALVTVRDAPHFHFRPAKSRDRKKLGEELYRQRLRKVDVIRAAG
ncbi:MAG TPA: hypothetical protein VMJ10_11595 [Kofleriaceae bacterium]|nr:hypothetical protein [Kofleriaceae bacterium]